MVLRIIAILLVLLAAERAAEACCIGCACTKYKNRGLDPAEVTEEPVYGYTHSVAGRIPRWSRARIAGFLATGTWKPITPTSSPNATQLDPHAHVVPAQPFQFVTAAKAGHATRANPVLIRRIEKHGRAILVEVNGRTFKLAPCLGKRGTTCLVHPGELALAPIPAPGATSSPAP
ncbi:MAG: hypothetical protein AB7P03_03320 [Kofleriaceae bacterium]